LRFLFYHWLLITLICDVKININQLILGRLNSYQILNNIFAKATKIRAQQAQQAHRKMIYYVM